MRRGLLGRVMELNTAASRGATSGGLEAATAEADRVLRERITARMERKAKRDAAAERIAETWAELEHRRQLENDEQRRRMGLPTDAELENDEQRRRMGLPTDAELEIQRILEEAEEMNSDDDDDDDDESRGWSFCGLRGCFGRNNETRRIHSTREGSQSFAAERGRGARRIARRTRSKARRSKARRSKARHSRRRTRSAARRSKARHSRRRTRSAARRSKAHRKRKGGRGTRKKN
jgi:hypothetical protein